MDYYLVLKEFRVKAILSQPIYDDNPWVGTFSSDYVKCYYVDEIISLPITGELKDEFTDCCASLYGGTIRYKEKLNVEKLQREKYLLPVIHPEYLSRYYDCYNTLDKLMNQISYAEMRKDFHKSEDALFNLKNIDNDYLDEETFKEKEKEIFNSGINYIRLLSEYYELRYEIDRARDVILDIKRLLVG